MCSNIPKGYSCEGELTGAEDESLKIEDCEE